MADRGRPDRGPGPDGGRGRDSGARQPRRQPHGPRSGPDAARPGPAPGARAPWQGGQPRHTPAHRQPRPVRPWEEGPRRPPVDARPWDERGPERGARPPGGPWVPDRPSGPRPPARPGARDPDRPGGRSLRPWDDAARPPRPIGVRAYRQPTAGAAGRPAGIQPARGRPPAALGTAVGLRDDEELVAGRRPVEEAFVARREARRLLVVPQRRQALERLVLHATSLRIPIIEVEGGTLTAIAGFDGHQGIALVVAPRRWASPDEVLAVAAARAEAPLVLVLDSLEDPQNVGTLLRTAEASGVHGAIFPTRRQAPLSPSAVKASAGAVEHLALAPVDDLPGAVADLHARGLRIVGADGGASLAAREADLRGPIAIVVGSEGKGLGPAIRRRCDLLVRIPMRGRIESLNAAVAGSILLYEAAAQRSLAALDPADRASRATVPPTGAPDAADGPAEGGPPADAPAGQPEV